MIAADVTARAADRLGIPENAARMLAAWDDLERAGHGIYRFPQLPATERDAYMLAVLWTGTEHACLSHDTAPAVYQACDINPERVHVTVPVARRIRRRGGERALRAPPPGPHAGADRLVGGHSDRDAPHCHRAMPGPGVPTYLLRQALEHGRLTGDVLREEGALLKARLEARVAAS